MAFILKKPPKTKPKKQKRKKRRVFRMFKRLDNGHFLIAGFVPRYPIGKRDTE